MFHWAEYTEHLSITCNPVQHPKKHANQISPNRYLRLPAPSPGPRVGLCVCERDEAVWVGQIRPDVGVLRGGEEEIWVEQHRLEKWQLVARLQEVVNAVNAFVGDVGEEVAHGRDVELLSHVGRYIGCVADDVGDDRIVEGVGDVPDNPEDVAHLDH